MTEHLGSLDVAGGAVSTPSIIRHKTDGIAAHAFLHHVIEANEGSTTNEQDLARIDLDAVLIGMFAATLRRHIGHGALEHFQKGLLNAFSRHVACDRGIFAFASDFVDFIDIDDPSLGLLHIHIGFLQQP